MNTILEEDFKYLINLSSSCAYPINSKLPFIEDDFKLGKLEYTNEGYALSKHIIHKLIDGIFYSSLICERDKIEEILDARTSDSIALALRFDAPIFTYSKILDKAGIIMKKEISEKNIEKKFEKGYKNISIKDLNKKINDAIEVENYELAAK